MFRVIIGHNHRQFTSMRRGVNSARDKSTSMFMSDSSDLFRSLHMDLFAGVNRKLHKKLHTVCFTDVHISCKMRYTSEWDQSKLVVNLTQL